MPQIEEPIGIPTLPTSVNIRLFLTTLIETNAMKRLITLITSAVLLCPMLAGAQTLTKTLNDLSWTGSLSLPNSTYPIAGQASAVLSYCNTITNITLQIQLPSNNSAIMPVNGYFNCAPADNFGDTYKTLLSGTMLAFGAKDAYYQLQLRLGGPATLECVTNSGGDLSMTCSFFTLTISPYNAQGITGPVPQWLNQAMGNFTIQ